MALHAEVGDAFDDCGAGVVDAVEDGLGGYAISFDRKVINKTRYSWKLTFNCIMAVKLSLLGWS